MIVQLTGKPKTGKTWAAKKLVDGPYAPLYKDAVYYINCDQKPMAWAGWRASFSKEKKNYAETSNPDTIIGILEAISEKRPDIKIVYVDTISTIEKDMEVADMKTPGYDKWKDFAMIVYDLYTIAGRLREDLIIIFSAHTESYEENGVTMFRTKHGGQKTTKLDPNSRIAYNLYTELKINPVDNTPQYQFVTQTDGTTEAGSVEGVLPLKMPNDLGEVVYRIRKYDLGIDDLAAKAA